MTICTKIIRAINPKTGQRCTWEGPNCEVDGKLIKEIPCKTGTDEPDMDNATDYYTLECN